MRHRISIFVAVIVFLPGVSSAQVVISEIMYDLAEGSDSGREWIEVFNAGGSSVNLTEWKLFENGSNHGIAAHTGGDMLASGAYAIIADNPSKFLEDWPNFSGALFDSAFSLNNTGESLVLRCCGSDVLDKDSVTYSSDSGGAGDGKTLQRGSAGSAAFSASTPTPGAGSLSAGAGDGTSNQNSTPPPSPSPTPQSAKTSLSYVAPPENTIFASAGEDRVVIVGADAELTGRAYDKKKEPLTGLIRYSWNFGDGSSSDGQTVLHRFSYPGRYAVVLQVAQETESASDTLVVEAKPAQLRFSALPDGALAIENLSERDLDLSRWILSAGGKTFVLPKGTMILADATVAFSPANTGLAQLTGEAALLYPNGVVAFRAGPGTAGAGESSAVSVPPTRIPAAPPPASFGNAQDTHPNQAGTETLNAGVLDVSNNGMENAGEVSAEAVAIPSQAAASTEAVPVSWVWWMGALTVTLASAGSVYFARHSAKKEWDIIEE